jgi:hypothetical protein
MLKTKVFGFVLFSLAMLFTFSSAQAATDTEKLQPAAPAEAAKIGDLGSYFDEYASYMQLSTALHSDQTSWWPDIHIGGQGVGGVTFFNGTIVNSTTHPETGADQPVTFGDKVRIDDYIYRNAPGASDEMPVLIGDGLSPALDDSNSLGEAARRWQYLYVSDNIYGENIIHEDNLSVTNDPTANYYLGYAGNNRFTWMKVSDHDSLGELESTVEDGEVIVRDGDSWTTRNVTETITENITEEGDSTIEEGDVLIREGDTWVAGSIEDLLSSLDCEDGEIIIYDADTTTWACSVMSDAIELSITELGDTITSTDTHMSSHDGDTSTTIDARFEQGRIEVSAGEVSACIGGYQNLGSATFTDAYTGGTENLIITTNYETSTIPSGGYGNTNVFPVEIIKTIVGGNVTGFTAYGCPPETGYVHWRAAGN